MLMYGEPNAIYLLRLANIRNERKRFSPTRLRGWDGNQARMHGGCILIHATRSICTASGRIRCIWNIAATPEYAYHADTINGRDIFRIGNALGIGAVGAWVDGKLVKVADVSTRSGKIISSGPVRSVIEIIMKAGKWAARASRCILASSSGQETADSFTP